MADAAGAAAQNVPYFLDTGENLIADFAKDPRLGRWDFGRSRQPARTEICTTSRFSSS